MPEAKGKISQPYVTEQRNFKRDTSTLLCKVCQGEFVHRVVRIVVLIKGEKGEERLD